MKFEIVDRSEAHNRVFWAIADALDSDKAVLWLASGGSNIDGEVEIMRRLREERPNELTNLTVLLMDERYGQAGHADSNYKIMTNKGFDPGAARFGDLLAGNLNLEMTTQMFGKLLEEAFDQADIVIGLFGMGADGHTAGIKPESPGALDPEQPAVGYRAADFERITLTPKMIRRIDQIFLLAYGSDKKPALEKLKSQNIALARMPAQVLKEIDGSIVYNDQVKGD